MPPSVPADTGTGTTSVGTTSVGTTTAKATTPDAASAGALRSWFDRPLTAKPPAPPSADETRVPADKAPAAPIVKAPAVPAGEVSDLLSATDTDTSSSDVDVTADEDDDWPTRYSWLDDEEADEAAESDDVTLPSDDAVAAEVEASDLPKPTSPDASKSPAGEG